MNKLARVSRKMGLLILRIDENKMEESFIKMIRRCRMPGRERYLFGLWRVFLSSLIGITKYFLVAQIVVENKSQGVFKILLRHMHEINFCIFNIKSCSTRN
jgi:hypothetical protein